MRFLKDVNPLPSSLSDYFFQCIDQKVIISCIDQKDVKALFFQCIADNNLHLLSWLKHLGSQERIMSWNFNPQQALETVTISRWVKLPLLPIEYHNPLCWRRLEISLENSSKLIAKRHQWNIPSKPGSMYRENHMILYWLIHNHRRAQTESNLCRNR